MNLFTGDSADDFFGGEVPPSVRGLLHQAAKAPRSDVGPLLWTAQAIEPRCLATYYALYKHHAGRREFADAERAASRGLAEAALQAGLPIDWRVVQLTQFDALPADAAIPARFWLFTLKALAFIALRSGRPADARALLARLEALDPQASVGNEVTSLLLQAAEAANPSALAGQRPADNGSASDRHTGNPV